MWFSVSLCIFVPKAFCQMCVLPLRRHLTDSLSTFGGQWQSNVTWSQHYLSLSRQFGVSSINPHPSIQCRKSTTYTYLRISQRGGECLPTWQKNSTLVTEFWVWAKIIVFFPRLNLCVPYTVDILTDLRGDTGKVAFFSKYIFF